MADREIDRERLRLRHWVETWRQAAPKLEAIRHREIQTVDTREAIRQLFGDAAVWTVLPPRTSSGLVEQQTWFMKLRTSRHPGAAR